MVPEPTAKQLPRLVSQEDGTPQKSRPDTVPVFEPLGLGLRPIELVGVLLTVIWAASQIVAVVPGLPISAFKLLAVAKAPVAACAAAALILLAAPRIIFGPAGRLILVFCGYGVARVLLQENPDFPQAAMIILWGTVTFVAFPSIFARRKALVVMMVAALIAVLIGVLFAVVANVRQEVDLFALSRGGFHGDRWRLTLGVANAVYFAKIGATLALGALLLRPFIESPTKRRLLLATIIAGSLLVFLTDTRAMMTCLAAAFAFYLAGIRTKWARRAAIVMVLVAIGVGATAFAEAIERPDAYWLLNRYSSGRLALWHDLADRTLAEGSALKAVFGAGRIVWGPLDWVRSISHSGGTIVEFSYQHLRADSVYLEIFLRQGLIGILLFAGAGYSLARRLRRARIAAQQACAVRSEEAIRAVQGILLGLALLCVFDSAIPSLGNVLNAFILPTAIAVAIWAERAVDARVFSR